jgi:hypothetical protein
MEPAESNDAAHGPLSNTVTNGVAAPEESICTTVAERIYSIGARYKRPECGWLT